ncbi:MAG: carboxypeptidase-like regulatory domain-containing protein [Terracidiphilus sp.]
MKMISNRAAIALVLFAGAAAPSGRLMAQAPEPVPVASNLLPEAPRPQSYEAEDKTTSDATKALPDGSTEAAAGADPAHISGTVTDVNGDLVPGATVILEGPHPGDRREAVSNDTAAFVFDHLRPGVSYRVRIVANGFSDWTSPPIVLAPGQFEFLTGVRLAVEGQVTSVTVYASQEQLATEQVHLEEQQRVLGFIPNFYVVYDSANAVALTTKLKFKLALRVSVDPVTVVGVGAMAAINQAADRPDFVQGAKGYGQRFGSLGADSFSDIMVGGAILPSLLHQDPRYFYQGSGTTSSRLRHALFSPFICRGDNGRQQINYSSLGGDLASSALSNAYYPQSNRGYGLVFGTFAIGTAERMISGIAQEFILPRLTPAAAKNANRIQDSQ